MVYQISMRRARPARDMLAPAGSRRNVDRDCHSWREHLRLHESEARRCELRTAADGLAALSPSAIGQSVSKSFKAGSDKISQSMKPKSEEVAVAIPAASGPSKRKIPRQLPNSSWLSHACKSRPANKRWPPRNTKKASPLDKNHLDALLGYAASARRSRSQGKAPSTTCEP